MKKRLLGVLLAGVMLAVPAFAAVPAYAEEVAVTDSAESSDSNLKEGSYEYKLLDDGTASLEKYLGQDKSVTLPTKLGGKKVTQVGEKAFESNNYIEKLVIPEGYTFLDEWAFGWCDNLSSVKLPSTLKGVCNSFPACDKLTHVDVPDDIENMYFMFWGCEGLVDGRIPSKVTETAYTFKGCTGLKTVVIEDGVTMLDNKLFCECTSLESVTIPASVTKISPTAFDDASPDVVIYGVKGSYAETYAKEHGITFKTNGSAPTPTPTPTPTPMPDVTAYILGDVDADGSITSSDALSVLRMSAGLSIPNKSQENAGDVDRDGSVTSSDAIAVLRHSNGFATDYAIGEKL